jgi:hypothetical protein
MTIAMYIDILGFYWVILYNLTMHSNILGFDCVILYNLTHQLAIRILLYNQWMVILSNTHCHYVFFYFDLNSQRMTGFYWVILYNLTMYSNILWFYWVIFYNLRMYSSILGFDCVILYNLTHQLAIRILLYHDWLRINSTNKTDCKDKMLRFWCLLIKTVSVIISRVC